MIIPYDKLITLEIARDSPIGIKMINKGISLRSPKHCFLSSYLLSEKAKTNSRWKCYLDIFPSDYSNFPIFFSEKEIDLLKGSPFLSKIIANKYRSNTG